MRARLVCRVRPGTTQAFDVSGEVVLGREPGNGVSLPLEGVSRLHARVLADGKSFWLEDLKSTNGTFLNGEPLDEREKLRHLDVISLGRHVDLLFLLREADPAAACRALGIVRAALVREGEGAVPYEVPMGEARLGRSPACNLQLESSSISKFHARVERSRERVVLSDDGSSNGTFVNGTRIAQPVELRHGDVVSLGGAEGLRVVIETGEVLAVPGATTTSSARGAEAPQWNADWRTRLEWSTSEMKALQELRQEEPATILRRPQREPATILRKPGEGPTVTKRPEPPAAPNASAAPPPARPPARAPVVKPATAPAPPPPAVAAPDAVVTQARPRPALPAAERVVALRLQAPGLDLTLREAGSWELGRSREAPIRIDHPTVSRRHARLVLDAQLRLSVEDLGAANGTFVNDTRLAPQAPQPLPEGDLLRLGDLRLVITRLRG